jgi:biopolymer transport protein ExbB/TolQ
VSQLNSNVFYALQNQAPEGVATDAVLMILSLVSWMVIVGKVLSLWRQNRRADLFYKAFQKCKDPFELVGRDKEFEGAPPYSVYDYGCREMQRMLDRFAPKEKTNGSRRAPHRVLASVRAAMERGLGDELQRLEGGMALLALAVSGGPFIGLFGTVLGVMDTFASVGKQGQATLETIAPGVAGALVATILGLVVAIPALFGFNLLQRRIQGLELDMTNFASELEALFTIDYIDTGAGEEEAADGRSLPTTHLAVTG